MNTQNQKPQYKSKQCNNNYCANANNINQVHWNRFLNKHTSIPRTLIMTYVLKRHFHTHFFFILFNFIRNVMYIIIHNLVIQQFWTINKTKCIWCICYPPIYLPPTISTIHSWKLFSCFSLNKEKRLITSGSLFIVKIHRRHIRLIIEGVNTYKCLLPPFSKVCSLIFLTDFHLKKMFMVRVTTFRKCAFRYTRNYITFHEDIRNEYGKWSELSYCSELLLFFNKIVWRR